MEFSKLNTISVNSIKLNAIALNVAAVDSYKVKYPGYGVENYLWDDGGNLLWDDGGVILTDRVK